MSTRNNMCRDSNIITVHEPQNTRLSDKRHDVPITTELTFQSKSIEWFRGKFLLLVHKHRFMRTVYNEFKSFGYDFGTTVPQAYQMTR